MASTKPNKEEIVVAGTTVRIYFDLIEKINTTLKETIAGRNVRLSLNQIAHLTHGEIGRFNAKRARTNSHPPAPSHTMESPSRPVARASTNFGATGPATKQQKNFGSPARKRRPTLASVLEPLTRYEEELTKPPVLDDAFQPTITGISDIVNLYRQTTVASGPEESYSTPAEKEKVVETPQNDFKVGIDVYGKPIHFLQDPPLPGPKGAQEVPFVPALQWDDAYFESRLPAAEDVYNASRQYMTDLSRPEQPEIFTRTVELARREAMERLKEEQQRKIREERWQEIVADVRRPDGPPQEMKCRRCGGSWMKVMELNRSKDCPDGKPRPVRCLVCRNYCCFLILEKDVPWEVGRLFGHPKKEELQYGRSRIDPKMNGDPTPRMKEYLEDLAIYRCVLREQGNFDEYPYTLAAGQKAPVRMM